MADHPDFLIQENCLVKYNGPGGDVVIPAGVIRINEHAFTDCDTVTSVVIPEGVTAISRQAFWECENLVSVTIAQTVTSIGWAAFDYCPKLTSVVIPESVQDFYGCIFNGCTGLTYVEVRSRASCKEIVPSRYSGTLYIPNMEPADLKDWVKDMAVAGFCRLHLQGHPMEEATVSNYQAYLVKIRGHICQNRTKDKDLIRYMLQTGLLRLQDIDKVLGTVLETEDTAYARELLDAKAALGAADSEGSKAMLDYMTMPLSQRVKIRQNLTEPTKVRLLEKTALSGTLEDMENLYQTYGAFEFTARALGYAARYNTSEVVGCMLEHGASFDSGSDSPAHIAKYGTPDSYHLYLLDIPISNSPKNRTLSDGQQRAASLELLHNAKEKCGFLEGKIYYRAVLHCDQPIIDTCEQLGIAAMPEYILSLLCSGGYGSMDASMRAVRDDFAHCLSKKSHGQLQLILEKLGACLGGRKWNLQPVDLYEKDLYMAAEVFPLMRLHSDILAKLTKQDMLTALITQKNVDDLDFALKSGWVKGEKKARELLELAQSQPQPDPVSIAVLVDYIQTKYAKKSGKKKDPLSLGANPLSATELKKLWAIKEREDGTLGIRYYKGTETDLVIPEKIGAKTVTAIEEDAFSPSTFRKTPQQTAICQQITSVQIPNTVTTIERDAFRDSRITEITVPGSVETIEPGTFFRCGSLQKAVLCEGVKKIEAGAFCGCAQLSALELPDSLETLGSRAFSDCEKLTDDSGFTIVKGTLYGYYGKEKGAAIPDHVTKVDPLSDSLEALADEAGFLVFKGELLKYYGTSERVDIPAGVTHIHANLFAAQFPSVKEIHVPEGVVSIADKAFTDCRFLSHIYLPESLEQMGKVFRAYSSPTIHGFTGSYANTYASLNNHSFVSEGISQKCRSPVFEIKDGILVSYQGADKDVVIPSGVALIGKQVFKGHTEIESVVISEGTEAISADAFRDCKNLRTIQFPESLRYVVANAFYGTPWNAESKSPHYAGKVLMKYVPETEEAFIAPGTAAVTSYAISGCEQIRKLTIPEGVKVLGHSAVYNCRNLQEVVLPSTLEDVSGDFLSQCPALERIVLPANPSEKLLSAFFVITDGVLREYKGRWEEVTIPKGVTHIRMYNWVGNFQGRKEIQRVTIPEGVAEIGTNTFAGCTNLKQVQVPDSLIHVGAHAFADTALLLECEYLGHVYLRSDPNAAAVNIQPGTRVIADGAFQGCKHLTKVVLPEGLEYIGLHAFADCPALTELVLPSTIKEIGTFAFDRCQQLKQILLPEGLEKLESYVFSNCTALTEVTLPSGLKEIGDSAFSCCESLRQITIPEGIRELPDSIFHRCSSLERIVLPGVLEKIGRFAFFGCKDLTQITIPEGVAVLEESSFYGCSSLREVTLPSTLTEVEKDIGFDGIPDLKIHTGEILRKKEKLSAYLRQIYTGEPADSAWIALYQADAKWKDALNTQVTRKPELLNEILGFMLEYLRKDEAEGKTPANRGAAFILPQLNETPMDKDLLKQLYRLMKDRKYPAAKKLEQSEEFMAYIG